MELTPSSNYPRTPRALKAESLQKPESLRVSPESGLLPRKIARRSDGLVTKAQRDS